ncbi:hypothetical protein [Actinoplanes sp. TFC3]|nr:hypothetical protein [Actinoplanes sp. TFC3]
MTERDRITIAEMPVRAPAKTPLASKSARSTPSAAMICHPVALALVGR